MTAEELKQLAEIAGLYLHVDTYFNGTIPVCFIDMWLPHLNIEQAMMVAEQYIEWSVGKTSLKEKEKLYHAYVCTSQDDDMWFRSFGKTPSEAICRAALAAAKEG